MDSNDGTLYMIRHESAQADDEWITPEPAEEVIVDAILAAGDLEADDLDDLSEYVDFATLAAVLNGENDDASFTIADHEVVVTSDGAVDVTAE